MKKIQEITKVALLGLGLDNLALLKLLLKMPEPIEITICDKRSKEFLPKIKSGKQKINYQLGSDFNKNLFCFDFLFRSPGWPTFCPGLLEAQKQGTYLSSALDVFFYLCPSKNIIGITGTKGKGTTATLIYEIIKAGQKNKKNKVWLGGNIGLSPLSFLDKVSSKDYVILELSSFQLETLEYSPKISVFTNLFKEHLAPADPNNPNYHKSFNSYLAAKLNIAKHQENKILIANTSLKDRLQTVKLKNNIKYFTAANYKTKLQGDYNQENIAAAVEVAKLLKIKKDIYLEVIANFNNLENRLELVLEKNNIKVFNNSFSTTPESTKLDLLSFTNPIIQLAGGADKGASFRDLAKTIKKKVKLIILFPGLGGEKIEAELKKIEFPNTKIFKAKSMETAVSVAWKKALPHDIILLSTACASFGLFKNYKERGRLFKEEIKKIAKNNIK